MGSGETDTLYLSSISIVETLTLVKSWELQNMTALWKWVWVLVLHHLQCQKDLYRTAGYPHGGSGALREEKVRAFVCL